MLAIEADWPDAYRVNSYVRGAGGDVDADAALRDFLRFPCWMWRNRDVLAFVDWLRSGNDRLPDGVPRVGFYGLDLYSLRSSIEAVIGYLNVIDPHAAERARRRYACFDHAGSDGQRYGYAIAAGRAEECEDAVVDQLLELRRQAADLASRDGRVPADAALLRRAERPPHGRCRALLPVDVRGCEESWNLRDRHMAGTLEVLLDHLSHPRVPARIVVWAHNLHIGDARATEMGQRRGELNLGQLAREAHGSEAVC